MASACGLSVGQSRPVLGSRWKVRPPISVTYTALPPVSGAASLKNATGCGKLAGAARIRLAPDFSMIQTTEVSVTTRNLPVKASPRGLSSPVTNVLTAPVSGSKVRISPSLRPSVGSPWMETKNLPSHPLVMLSGRGPTGLLTGASALPAGLPALATPVPARVRVASAAITMVRGMRALIFMPVDWHSVSDAEVPTGKSVDLSLCASRARVQVLLGQALRCPVEPRLDDQLGEVRLVDLLQPHEDRRVPVEVRGREVDVGVLGEQRVLSPEVGYPRAQDRSLRSVVAQRLEVRPAQRPLPHEALVPNPPLQRPLVRGLLDHVRQGQADPVYVVPGGHARIVGRTAQRVTRLRGGVADRLDIVAVRVADEGAVVGLVVLREDPGLVQHLGAGRHGSLVERVHRGPVGGHERHVYLAGRATGLGRPDPERRPVRAVADHVTEVHQPLAAQRGEHCVVEGRAGGHVAYLKRQVIDHPDQPPLFRWRQPRGRPASAAANSDRTTCKLG